MIPWTRRRFLGASTAAICVGCADVDSGVSTAPPPPTGPNDRSGGSFPSLTFLVEVGPLERVRADADVAPVFVPSARAWVVRVAESAVDDKVVASDESLRQGLEAGLLALYQRCPHLGCRVPFCESSGWFECPCHGSKYTSLGEHRAGPGPRGMDAFPIVIDGQTVSIDTGTIVRGRPIGTVLVDQPADGPHCLGLSES